MSFRIVKLIDPIQIVNIPSGLVPKGAYSALTDYDVGDSVAFSGSSYVMYSNATAGTLPTNITYWQVLSEKGETGATGAAGATGGTGSTGSISANSGTIIVGDGTTDGSWKIMSSGSTLSFQRLESASWVEKGAVTA